MKETVFGPHSENTVLFMNGSGWKQQSWTLGGTHCPLVFRGKSQVSVRSLHPSLCGGRRGVVKGPDREQGSGERVRTVSMATNGNPSYFTETHHDKIMASGLSFKKSCPTLNKTSVIC